ncbi:uncharacterized protein LOC141852015 [Brevipalpus obovatus]|uniref:uncharacterized protein LOC141852015 n=1 Tax=Brevipalpus obovatus TaxID=246614 RepID=UPI003D9E18A6
MNFCDPDSMPNKTLWNLKDGSPPPLAFYTIGLPVMLFCGLISFILNGLLVILRNTRTMKTSPVLILSLNLAATDGINSLIATYHMFRIYLELGFQVLQMSKCESLILETCRLSSYLASFLHLLALTWLHYEATINPLHHRLKSIFHDRMAIHALSLLAWSVSIAFFTMYFFSIPCQGFRVHNCPPNFFLYWSFRRTLLICYTAPLAFMIAAYLRILIALHFGPKVPQILMSQNGSRKESNLNKHKSIESKKNSPAVNDLDINKQSDINKNNSKSNICYSDNSRHTKRAIVTSLIIIGTYLCCLIPNLAWLSLTCMDGCPLPALKQSSTLKFTVGYVTQFLIIMKGIVDPFIYSYRLKEVRYAMKSVFTGSPVDRMQLARRSTYCMTTNSVIQTPKSCAQTPNISNTIAEQQREHYL